MCHNFLLFFVWLIFYNEIDTKKPLGGMTNDKEYLQVISCQRPKTICTHGSLKEDDATLSDDEAEDEVSEEELGSLIGADWAVLNETAIMGF